MTTTSKPISRVANLLFQLRVGSDANLFGRMVYGLFHIWGVEGLPPLPNPPKNLTQISKVPRGYGISLGKQAYNVMMSKFRDKEKVEEALSEFLTIKIMDKQHKLADKFRGKTLAEAEKIVIAALRNFTADLRRQDTYKDRHETQPAVDEDSGAILDTPDGGSALDEVLTPPELDQVVREVQRVLAPKNPDIARDIPLYFEHLMDGMADSQIINNKMLPFLQDRPMSQQAWSKGYKEVIKKVLDKHLERNASASLMTLSRVASLVVTTAPKVSS